MIRPSPLLLVIAAVVAATACRSNPPDLRDPSTAGSPPAASGQPAAPTTAPAASDSCRRPCRRGARSVGAFRTQLAPEASGLVASRRNRGLLYVLDDGPGTTSLLVIQARNARVMGRLGIRGLNGTDTEAIAAAPCGDTSCVYIGDIGDNTHGRDTISVTRVREPRLDDTVPVNPVPSDTITLRYPDAPADAEALLAGDDGRLGIVTKDPGRSGGGRARLFLTDGFRDQTLQDAGRIRLPPPRSPLAAAVVGNVVTGGDAVRGRVVLRTYDALYEFIAPDNTAPLATFGSWRVRQLSGPPEVQGEAVAYGPNGCDLFTVSESSGELWRLSCR